MKPRASLLAVVFLPLAVSWLPAAAADTAAMTVAVAPLYNNDFQAAALDKVPADFMVMAGAFAVKSDGANLFLELPGAPLENFGLLFGPVSKDGVSATGRFFGSKQGRKFPTFGVSLNGVGGYRLQVSPAKKALEIYKGDDLKISVPYDWVSETWIKLRIQVRKTSDNVLAVEGRVWAADAPEPTTWMIALEDKEETPAGRAGIWGSPYSGTPIRFDDLVLTPAK